MNIRIDARFVFAAACGTLFALSSGEAAAQVGHVVSAQKISDTSGGFTAPLDEEDQFGRSIVNLGDLDQDGVSDLLVGAHTDDDGGIDQGAVYVLFLHANGFVKAWQKISDESGNFVGQLDPGDQFGRAAANLGDVDGDGVVDVAVSSNYDDDGGANKGAVYVLFLNRDGTVKSHQKISALTGGLPAPLRIHDEFGRSLTALGDLDGDGRSELVVGTPEDDEGGTNTGALHVLFLNADGTVKDYRRISKFASNLAIKPGDWFGFCTANLGDLDGDGVVDIAAGAVLNDDGGVNQGSLWILLLNGDGSVKSSFEIGEGLRGFDAQLDDIDQFGTSVANLGDLDGDGVIDLAVGAVKDDDGGLPGNADADVGAVYVLFLNADATVKSWVKIGDLSGDLPYALDQYDWFGSALCRLGGSSGDGLFNLAIGCRNDDDGSPNRGSVYLVQLNDGTAPGADFSASRTLGVAPLTVSFADASTGEVTAWVWSFSDGPQSSLQNPTKTFATPGTYDVQLTARGPRGRDSETKRALVTVVAGPLADFMATPTQGLAPLAVQFSDASEGQVTSWAWDFGDGAFSSERHPAHAFAAGTHTVRLTVTGPSGTDTRTRTDFVVAEDLLPRVQFTADARTGYAPHAVQFGDLSTGAVSSWSWSFGDGAVSNERDPQHTYAAPGAYTVALTAAGPYGSALETRSGWIVVTSPVPAADLGATPLSGTAPLTVHFNDLSSGHVTSHLWSFGDGASSSASSPTHVYEEPGTYTVALSVAGPDGSDTATRTALIVVAEPPPFAEFQASSTIGFAPLTIEFTDQSSGLVSARLWSFGDGASSSDEAPAHTYTEPGLYSVELLVQGPTGVGSELKSDLIRVDDPTPVAAFGAPLTSGVAPLAVQFSDVSSGLVSAWSWDFGDGTSGVGREPEHVYSAPGTYTVTLTAAGPFGSDVESKSAFVTVQWPAPVPEFTAGPVTGFAPLPVAFTDLSSGNVTSWSWNFGDGTTSRARFPVKVYTRTGAFTVTLTAKGPGGSRTITHGGITVAMLPQFPDGGFEQDSAGSPPGAPWTELASAGALVRSNTTPDAGFPREGTRWLDLDGAASVAATPPANPGGIGAPAEGTAGVHQVFAYSPLAPHLVFDAAFLLGDAAVAPDRNDFLSIDLTDGSTSWNLFYADGFSELPGLSTTYGLPMTDVQRVHVDLRELFPTLPAGAPLTLRIGVGNGGDGAAPSRGYVDALRLVPAATAGFRNGTGRNAARYVSSPAVLGGAWTIQVDTTGHAGARAIQVVGMQRPASGALRAAGEVLTSGQKLFSKAWLVQPGLVVRTVTLPEDLNLMGLYMATQVTITGGRAELCNAYDLVLGF
jgi:PKD repeat protein